MGRTEVPFAERALQPRVGATLLDAAKPRVIPLLDALAVLQVRNEISLLGGAALPVADRLIAAQDVGMRFAKRLAAIDACLHGREPTARKKPTQLARFRHALTVAGPGRALNAGQAGAAAACICI